MKIMRTSQTKTGEENCWNYSLWGLGIILRMILKTHPEPLRGGLSNSRCLYTLLETMSPSLYMMTPIMMMGKRLFWVRRVDSTEKILLTSFANNQLRQNSYPGICTISLLKMKTRCILGILNLLRTLKLLNL